MNEVKAMNKSGIIPGLIAAWPICLGYIPIGLALKTRSLSLTIVLGMLLFWIASKLM